MRSLTAGLIGGALLSSTFTVNVGELWKLPAVPLQAKTANSYPSEHRRNIKVEEVYYSSSINKSKPSRIFGYFCYPAVRNGKLPAVLLVHGGGGGASLGRASSWASRGYAVLAIDLPGKGENRGGSRSTGPDMEVKNLLRTAPDPSHNYLVHAVAAARCGITYLSQRKEVDPGRIGMVGLSWGGVITLITNGLDDRLKTAVNVFGAGFIPEGCTWDSWFGSMSKQEMALWSAYLDPKNFLAGQKAPILFISGANDHCYYLNTFQKSYLKITAPKHFVLIPNLRHRFLAESQQIVWQWLDTQLKETGSLPQVELINAHRKNNDKVVIAARVFSAQPIDKIKLYYAKGSPSFWTEKKWEGIEAYLEDGVFHFGIPAKLIEPEIQFYVKVDDETGGTGSTLVRSLLKAQDRLGGEDFILSSAVVDFYQHSFPLQMVGRSPTVEGLYFSKEKRKYYYRIDSQPLAKRNHLPRFDRNGLL